MYNISNVMQVSILCSPHRLSRKKNVAMEKTMRHGATDAGVQANPDGPAYMDLYMYVVKYPAAYTQNTNTGAGG